MFTMRQFRTRHRMQKRKNMVDRWKLSTVRRSTESSNRWSLTMQSTSPLWPNLLVGASMTRPIDIPVDWTHITPDAMTIDDGHHSSWEYSRKEVRQGHMFHDKVHLQHCWYFLCSSREFYKHRHNTVVALHQEYSNVSLFIYSLGKAEARNDNK